MNFEYPIENSAILGRELSRPWIYSARHFRAAFDNSQSRNLPERVSEVGQGGISPPQNIVGSRSQNLGERISHFCLGLLELIPVVNYIVAIAEALFATFATEKKKLNDGIPLDQLPTDEIIERAEQGAIDIIYDIVESINELFKRENIKYSVDGGSQLGATRHGGIIPWDDDADMVALKEDKDKIENLKRELNRRGLDLYYYEPYGIIKIFRIDGKSQGNWTYPSIDVFLIEEDDQNPTRYVLTGEESKKKWPEEYFTKDQWDRVKEVDFGHLKVSGLSGDDAEQYCSRAYGETWRVEAYKTHTHKDWAQNPWIVRTQVKSDCARHTKDPRHPNNKK